MSNYFLTRHVHICSMPSEAIVLDLRADRYLSFNKDQVSVLARQVRGWPASNQESRTVSDEDARAFAAQLLTMGILTADPSRGKCVDAPIPNTIAKALLEEHEESTSHLRPSSIAKFVIALAQTQFSFRCRSLHHAIARFDRSKRGYGRLHIASSHELKHLVQSFSRLRPYFYVQQYQCLFDSLVLANFLLLHAVDSNVVIGVTASPFEAHAWVQSQTWVLNGSADYARRFQPILTV